MFLAFFGLLFAALVFIPALGRTVGVGTVLLFVAPATAVFAVASVVVMRWFSRTLDKRLGRDFPGEIMSLNTQALFGGRATVSPDFMLRVRSDPVLRGVRAAGQLARWAAAIGAGSLAVTTCA